MGKKAHHEEHENLEAWVIPYADLLTLLLAMFLALYATSNTDLQKMKALATAFRSEAGGAPSEAVDPGVKSGGNGDNAVASAGAGIMDGNGMTTLQKQVLADIQAAVASEGEKALNELAAQRAEQVQQQQQTSAAKDALQAAIDETGQGANVQLTQSEDGLTLSISENLSSGLSFNSGSSKLNDRALFVLGPIADALKSVDGEIQITGHTDSTGDAATNLALSLQRANAVADAISSTLGIPRERILTGGKGESELLVVPDDNDAAHIKNRRVDIKILSPKPLTTASAEPTGAQSATAASSDATATTSTGDISGGDTNG
ncbi:MAG: OmpA family protein [Acidimicrobiia bacterium]